AVPDVRAAHRRHLLRRRQGPRAVRRRTPRAARRRDAAGVVSRHIATGSRAACAQCDCFMTICRFVSERGIQRTDLRYRRTAKDVPMKPRLRGPLLILAGMTLLIPVGWTAVAAATPSPPGNNGTVK